MTTHILPKAGSKASPNKNKLLTWCQCMHLNMTSHNCEIKYLEEKIQMKMW
jgi:hypothetical protein